MKKIVLYTIAALAVLAGTLQSFTSGAPTGRTGGLGESTCISCHAGSALNSGPGSVSFAIAGSPTQLVGGQTYDVTITMNQTGRSKFGFEIKSVDAGNTQSGTFTLPNSTEFQIRNSASKQYVTHRSTGTAGTNTRSWTFQWMAPNNPTGDVGFYFAGLAANGSGSSGDNTYASSVTFPFQALPAIDADFTQSANAVCVGDTITYTNASTGTITDYNWNFGADADPASAVGVGPHRVVYASSGAKMVSLTIDDGNQTDMENKMNTTINALPAANAGADVTICVGGSAQLMASGGTSYLWQPTSTLDDSTSSSPIASPTTNSVYSVAVTDANGCSASDDVLVSVSTGLTIALSGDTAICEGDSTQLVATGAASYSWSPSTGLDDPNSFSPFANPTTTTTYTVIGQGGVCADTQQITVNVQPAISLTASNDTTICFDGCATLSVSGADTYSWSPGIYLNDSTLINPIAMGVKSTIFTVTGTTFNCRASETVVLTVQDSLITTISPSDTICEGDQITLSSSSQNGGSFSWSPATSLDDATASSPVASPTSSTTYEVAIAQGVCVDTLETIVNVEPRGAGQVSFQDTSLSYLGSSISPFQLSASGGSSYLWSPNKGLDDSTSSSPTIVTDGDIIGLNSGDTLTYTVFILGNNCIDTLNVRLVLSEQVSVRESIGVTDLILYPNPLSGNKLTVQLPNYQESWTITLHGLDGTQYELLSEETGSVKQINMPEFPSGLYIIEAKSNTIIARTKLLIP